MDVKQYMAEVGAKARRASRAMAAADTAVKNKALLAMATALEAGRPELLTANQKDMDSGRANGLDAALLDRLELTDARIDTMIEGLHQVANLADPVGQVTDLKHRPSGIQVGSMRVPLGSSVLFMSRVLTLLLRLPACV